MTSSEAKTQNRPAVDEISPCSSASSRLCDFLFFTAWIAAVFCLLVCAGMIYQRARATQHDPWKSPQLLALKDKLVTSPQDENLKREIRRSGSWNSASVIPATFAESHRRVAVIGGMAVMLLAAKQAAKLRTPFPMPRLNPDAESHALRAAAQSRWSVAGIGVVAAVMLATLAFTARSRLPNSAVDWKKLSAGGTTANEVVADLPALAEFFANWPRFRGPDGGGASASTNGLPLTWDDKTGAGMFWKSPVPAPGYNSPIVWSNRVFVSGGDAQKREVFCFDTADGKLLWRRAIENVPGSPAEQPDIPDEPGFAAATMATRRTARLCFIWANGDLAALTFDGAPCGRKILACRKILTATRRHLPSGPVNFSSNLIRAKARRPIRG